MTQPVSNSGSNDRQAIQNALDLSADGDVFLASTGNYFLDGPLYLNTPKQKLFADNRERTRLVFQIPSGSWPEPDGCIIMNEAFQCIENVGILFNHPPATRLSDLYVFPWAIRCVATRSVLNNVLIDRPHKGVYAPLGGGSSFSRLHMNAFEEGLRLGGALDTVLIDDFRFWDYNSISTIYPFYHDTVQTALSLGYIDDLKLTNSTLYRARLATFEEQPPNKSLHGPNGQISNLAMDGDGAWFDQNGGNFDVSGFYSAKQGGADQYHFRLSKGDARFSCTRLRGGSTTGLPSSTSSAAPHHSRAAGFSPPSETGWRRSRAARGSISSTATSRSHRETVARSRSPRPTPAPL